MTLERPKKKNHTRSPCLAWAAKGDFCAGFGALASRRWGPILMLLGTLGGCLPYQAGDVREEKFLTMAPNGGSVRITRRHAVAWHFLSHRERKVPLSQAGTRDSLTTFFFPGSRSQDPTELRVDFAHMAVSSSYQSFPWEDSAFFGGLGLSIHQLRSSFLAETVRSNRFAPDYTRISEVIETYYLTVPLGWAWIWPEGFSLSAELGPRLRIYQKKSFTEDGLAQGVRVPQRDYVAGILRQHEGPFHWGGIATIGWSLPLRRSKGP